MHKGEKIYKMKRLIAITMIMCMVCGLFVACDKNKPTEPTNTAEPTAEATQVPSNVYADAVDFENASKAVRDLYYNVLDVTDYKDKLTPVKYLGSETVEEGTNKYKYTVMDNGVEKVLEVTIDADGHPTVTLDGVEVKIHVPVPETPEPSEEPTPEPENTPEPEVTEDPNATNDPEATENPEATNDPEATEDPEGGNGTGTGTDTGDDEPEEVTLESALTEEYETRAKAEAAYSTADIKAKIRKNTIYYTYQYNGTFTDEELARMREEILAAFELNKEDYMKLIKNLENSYDVRGVKMITTYVDENEDEIIKITITRKEMKTSLDAQN